MVVGDVHLAKMRIEREEGLSDKRRNSEVGGESSLAAGVTVNLSSSCDCVLQKVASCRYKEFGKDTLPPHVIPGLKI